MPQKEHQLAATAINNNNNNVRKDSESEADDNPPTSTNSSRSRQKKFLKKFKHLPHSQEEIVLQRYSCALVGDILLQGHLYITENYFAFYSNVFGYVTKLQIPIRSVLKITKEKTAKIIPNAVGLTTAEEKHVFSSLLSRDTTYKFMTRVWKRAMRDVVEPTPELIPAESAAVLETELEECEEEALPDDETSESDVPEEERLVVDPLIPIDTCDSPSSGLVDDHFLMKRCSETSGTLFYQTKPRMGSIIQTSGAGGGGGGAGGGSGKKASNGDTLQDLSQEELVRKAASSNFWGLGDLLDALSLISKSTLLSILIIAILSFLLLSSIYLIFRINNLQQQVESRYNKYEDWNSVLDPESSERMQKVLDTNVDQISTVRKSLEKLSHILENSNHPVKDET